MSKKIILNLPRITILSGSPRLPTVHNLSIRPQWPPIFLHHKPQRSIASFPNIQGQAASMDNRPLAHSAGAPYSASGYFGNPYNSNMTMPYQQSSQSYSPFYANRPQSFTTSPTDIGIVNVRNGGQVLLRVEAGSPWVATSFRESMAEYLDSHLQKIDQSSRAAAQQSAKWVQGLNDLHNSILHTAGTSSVPPSELKKLQSRYTSMILNLQASRSVESQFDARRNQLIQDRTSALSDHVTFGAAKSILKTYKSTTRTDRNGEKFVSPFERLTTYASNKKKLFKDTDILRDYNPSSAHQPSWPGLAPQSSSFGFPGMPPYSSGSASSIPSGIFSNNDNSRFGPALGPWAPWSFHSPSSNSYVPPGGNWH
ncbi:uncharacterized protein I206_101312 [Kwoniella pini CBS 10737]|uniref:Uncharacterized protein n=1 Tax=Kwoniella pini CBS 10737 TaxID=1296096 RepID=A0A1B9IAZ7_9TREE|nr:uncharacterized protein I206_00012 [Kwoniella pini CBS 10737]OCF52716.1 hypothetical protein I206_00012 [Kwoniella pini CBS 10737]